MPNNENAAETAQQQAVKADWGALTEDFSEVVVQEEVLEDNAQKQSEDTALDQEKQEEINLENKEEGQNKEEEDAKAKEAEASKEEGDEKENINEEKNENSQDNSLFTVDDLKDVPKVYEDGTWKGLAKDLFNAELQDESFEAVQQYVKENYVPKSELEKAQQISLDSIYAALKPETATALKLMEMGVSEAEVFESTKRIDNYLKLDDAAIVRADLELTEGWADKPELIDARIEELSADPKKLNLQAEMIRINLNNQKKEIVQERQSLLQEYEQSKQNAVLQKKQQEVAQFNEALDKFETFMGQPVSKEVKNALRLKYNNGGYSDIVNNPLSQINAIMYKEYGDKIAKHLQNKASEDAKLKTTKKLLNVPPVTGGAGNRVETSAENQSDNNWGALKEDFSGK